MKKEVVFWLEGCLFVFLTSCEGGDAFSASEDACTTEGREVTVYYDGTDKSRRIKMKGWS